MKIVKMMSLSFALVVMTLGANAQKAAKWSEVTIQTNGTCQSCKDKIEGGIAYEKGVKDVEYDLATAKVKVVYNAEKTSPDNLRLAINKLGFDADSKKAADCAKSCGSEKKHSCSGNHDHDHDHDHSGHDHGHQH